MSCCGAKGRDIFYVYMKLLQVDIPDRSYSVDDIYFIYICMSGLLYEVN